MKGALAILSLTSSLAAQTTVYLRASGPASTQLMGATATGQCVIAAGNPSTRTAIPHGFASTCGISTPCYCVVGGLAANNGTIDIPSSCNGIRECKYVDPTHLSLYDLSGSPVAANGAWSSGANNLVGEPAGSQWVAQLTPYTLGSQPLGWLDGPTGNLMRRISLSPANGLTSVSTTGCPSACVITVATSYDPTAGNFPIAATNKFSVTGTGTSLDTCGDGTVSAGAQSPYTVASANSSGWTSNAFACSISNTNYTSINNACGPAVTPDDTIGGAQSCIRISQIATTANPWWTGLLSMMSGNLSTSPNYKSVYDGGTVYPDGGYSSPSWGVYNMPALRFLVDPTSAFWLTEILYSLNNVQREAGVSYNLNSQTTTQDAGGTFTTQYSGYALSGLALDYSIAAPYWTAAEKTVFLNKMYNNADDPNVSACTMADNDVAQAGHTTALATGVAQAGSSTSITLASGDTAASGYYNNNVVKAIVLPGGLVSGTYVSGITATGSIGQTCILPAFNGGGAYAAATVALTGTNTIAGGSPLVVTGRGYSFTSNPTSATVTNGSATCSGTAVVSTIAGSPSYGAVSTSPGYNSSTKVATVAAWSGGTPTAGTPYTIYSSVTVANSGRVTTTLTGYNTTFTSSVQIGDAIIGVNSWIIAPENSQSYVCGGPGGCGSPITSDTSLTVINGLYTSATAIPSIMWYVPAWKTGDCGRVWAAGYQIGFPGSQPSLSPPAGGSQSFGSAGIGEGLNTTWLTGASMFLDLVTAPDDPRAVRDLAFQQSSLFDYEFRHELNYWTGFEHNGNSYTTDAVISGVQKYIYALTQSVPTYPSMDQTGPISTAKSLAYIFSVMPDLASGGSAKFLRWGSNNTLYVPSGTNDTLMDGLTLDSSFAFAPASNSAKYYRNFLENLGPYSRWGQQGLSAVDAAITVMHNDPRIGSSDYKAQPHQYAFDTSSEATCATLTGWPCPTSFRGDVAISRTGFSSTTDTLLAFNSRTFSSGYDGPDVGIRLYKRGDLLSTDFNNGPGATQVNWLANVQSDTPNIGTSQFVAGLVNGSGGTPGYTPIVRWASVNHGSWSPQYGDQNSRYAYVCSDVSGLYNQVAMSITIQDMLRCVAHFKKSGNDEFILQLDTFDAPTTPTPMNYHEHYIQNGQAHDNGGSYTTGLTTCPGSGGCASLNTNRLIQSVEDGSDSPARNYGLMSHFDSPGTITLVDDCVGHGGGQCAPGDTYVGGSGYTHRITIAGGSSVGANVTTFNVLAEHKLMQNLTDTTLATTALNPDANWTGSQVCGATSCAVFVGALGGTAHGTMTGFTTTHSGTAQYLFGGLTAGTYTVTVNSAAVTGSPFTVGANDNSIYFESTAGTVSVNGSVAACSISTTTLPGGTVGVAYSQPISTTSCATPVTWSISAGTLCTGLSLGGSTSTTDTIGGTPTTAQTCSFTVQAVDAALKTASQALSITIATGAAAGASSISASTAISVGTIKH